MMDMSWSDKIGMYISGTVSHNTRSNDAHEYSGGQMRTLSAQQQQKEHRQAIRKTLTVLITETALIFSHAPGLL